MRVGVIALVTCCAFIDAQENPHAAALLRINKRRAACKLPPVHPMRPVRKVGRGFEVHAGDGVYFSLNGRETPDPCSDDVLAVTQERADAVNAQQLGWTAVVSEEMTGTTTKSWGFPRMRNASRYRAAPSNPNQARTASKRARALSDDYVVPDDYDARDTYPDEQKCKAFRPRHQLQCASCAIFATLSSLSARLCLQNGRSPESNVVLAPQHITECVNGCAGTYDSHNMNWFSKNGMKEEWCKPYTGATANNCSAMCQGARTYTTANTRMAMGERAMQIEVLLNGPVAITAAVYDDIWVYSSGVYSISNNAAQLQNPHSMMLVGWGVDNGSHYWTLQNSWGTGWGNRGFVRWARGVDMGNIETWGITASMPRLPTDCPKTPCGYGSVTLASGCRCRCDDPFWTGANCTTPAANCTNGGVLTRLKDACVCPTGFSGPWCQNGANFSHFAAPASSASTRQIRITFTYNPPPSKDTIVGLYNMSSTNWSTAIASTHICGPSQQCNATKNVELPHPTQPGRYKLVAMARNAATGMYPVLQGPVGYFTVLPDTATPEQVAAAAAENDPAVKVRDFFAAEDAQHQAIRPRLETGRAAERVVRQLAKEALPVTLTVDALSAGQQTWWRNSPPTRVCYSIPTLRNTPTKELRLVSLNIVSHWQPLPAAREACINYTLTKGSGSGFQLQVADPKTRVLRNDGLFDAEPPMVSSSKFTVPSLTWKSISTTNTSTPLVATITAILSVSPNPSPTTGDRLRFINNAGAVAAECLRTASTTYKCTVPRVLGAPTRGPYTIRYFASNIPTAVFVYTPTPTLTNQWKNLGL